MQSVSDRNHCILQKEKFDMKIKETPSLSVFDFNLIITFQSSIQLSSPIFPT